MVPVIHENITGIITNEYSRDENLTIAGLLYMI